MKELAPIMARLRQRRIELGLTQLELANLCDLTQGCIGNLETGRHQARPKTLRAIAAALGEVLP